MMKNVTFTLRQVDASIVHTECVKVCVMLDHKLYFQHVSYISSQALKPLGLICFITNFFFLNSPKVL
jgi:hypothetical protein